MEGLILAAGLGSRLGSLTENCPKALVPVNKKEMILYIIEKMKYFGISTIYVNVYHHKDKLLKYLNNLSLGVNIVVIEEECILGTGGAISNMFNYPVKEDLLVHNVDIITNLSFSKILYYHQKSEDLITLVCQKRKTNRLLLIDDKNYLKGHQDLKNSNTRIYGSNRCLRSFGFTGIQIISPSFWNTDLINNHFSSIDLYLELVKRKIKIKIWELAQESYWMDIGTPDNLEKANEDLKFSSLKNIYGYCEENCC